MNSARIYPFGRTFNTVGDERGRLDTRLGEILAGA
jgi:hypothetical protein